MFGPGSDNVKQSLKSTPLSGFVKSNVKNLAFVFDSNLKMDSQINSVVRTSFFNLRLLVKTKPFFAVTDFEKAALVFTRMDYCNSLFYGIEVRSLARLQKVQNAAARMIKSATLLHHF